jgi:hypothetical protein
MKTQQMNRMVNADIVRFSNPNLRRYIVTVNYREEVEVLASSEDNAIDRVLMDTSYDVRVLNCNDLEVLV